VPDQSESSSALLKGVEQMNLKLEATVVGRLLDYADFLLKWNKTYNLTAIRDSHGVIVKHLLDSLSVLSFCPYGSVLDIGAGAGLPSVVLAVANPNLSVTAIDSNSKKTRFLQQCVYHLNLTNLRVLHQRAEHLSRHNPYDFVVSRAFSSLKDFFQVAMPVTKPSGLILAMKGRYPHEELEAAGTMCDIKSINSLTVPFLDEERHIVVAAPKA
jgi:16S rRNA (guanine527-N7)-methyltransferase